MAQKLPVDGFKRNKISSRITQKLYKTMMVVATKDTSFRLTLVILSIYRRHTVIFPLLLERVKVDKCQKLVYNMYDKKAILSNKKPKVTLGLRNGTWKSV